MYKLREQRLKEFYTSGEIIEDIQNATGRTNVNNRQNTNKGNMTTHADNLADDSFLSLKSKEIRDSESPTRDVGYKTVDKRQDQNWTITSTNERSTDGKTHSTSLKAETSGSQAVGGGKVDYSAQHQQKATAFQEGDDQNFTKSFGTSSNTVMVQEGSGGDDNSNFKTSTTKTSSSSRYVTETKSSSGDVQDLPVSITEHVSHSSIYDQVPVSSGTKIYTTNAPSDIKSHPSYVEGKTKVTQETKTLNDGTVVTTTRYETKIGNTTQTAVTKKYNTTASSKSEQKFSTSGSQIQSSSNVVSDSTARSTRRDSQFSTKDDHKAIDYVIEPGSTVDITLKTVKGDTTSHQNQDLKSTRRSSHQQSSTNVIRESSSHVHSSNKKVSDSTAQSTRRDSQITSKDDHKAVDYIIEPGSTVDITFQTARDDNRASEDVKSSKSNTHQQSSTSVVRESHIYSSDNVLKDTKQKIQDGTQYIEYIIEPSSTAGVNIKTIKDNVDTRRDSKTIKKNEQLNDQHTSNISVAKTSDQSIKKTHVTQTVPGDTIITTTKTTKTIVTEDGVPKHYTTVTSRDVVPERSTIDTSRTTKTTSVEHEVPKQHIDTKYNTTLITTVNQNQDLRDTKKIASDHFITTERQHEVDTRKVSKTTELPKETYPKPVKDHYAPSEDSTHTYDQSKLVRAPSEPYAPSEASTYTCEQPKFVKAPYAPSEASTYTCEEPKFVKSPHKEPYEQPQRRHPIKPGKSEMDQKPQPTEGQYDTTYRSDYTNKKISVEVSATHDAFARSLRAVTPERITKLSNTSLRSSVSPEKNRQPARTSPERQHRSRSPKKFPSTDTITYTQNKRHPDRSSPSKSPDYIPVDRRIVNGDIRESSRRESYSTDTITRKSKTTADKTVKETFDSSTITRRKGEPRSLSPTGTTSTDFEYIRSISEVTTDLDDETSKTIKHDTTRPSTLEITKKTKKVTERSPTSPLADLSSPRRSPTKESPKKSKSPTKEIPSNQDKPKLIRTDTYEERVKQILGITDAQEKRRSSLERNSLKRSSLKETSTRTSSQSPVKSSPTAEFPNQMRKSPEKQTPQRKSSSKDSPAISEFPSQIIKSPERKLSEPFPQKTTTPTKNVHRVSKFPSQVRKSPEKERPKSPQKVPEKKSPRKEGPSIGEFPSQIRKSPEKQPLEPYPERKPTKKQAPSVSEIPSQVRKSPEKEPLQPYPEKQSPKKQGPYICEFPSQIRKSPQREPLEPYPEKKSPRKQGLSVSEFPSQIRKSPEKELLETYPERKSPKREKPTVCEFPAQIRKSPEKEVLEPYPEKVSPRKEGPSVCEFPSQIRKSPEKEPWEPYPEKKSPRKEGPSICEFPSQIRKSPEKESLEPYPEKRSPQKQGPTIGEFPSQIRKSPEKEPLQPYPERKSPSKQAPAICEFPSQIRKSPEKEPLKPYPERKSPEKDLPFLSEFSTQTRKSPERKPSKKDEVPLNSEFSSTPKPKKELFPSTGRTPKKNKKPRTSSQSSTTTDEETEDVHEIEENITRTEIDTVESRIPIDEPVVEKRLFSQLCREDEIDRRDSKKSTRDLIEAEIIQNDIEKQIVDDTKITKKQTKLTDIDKKSTETTTTRKSVSRKPFETSKHTESFKKPTESPKKPESAKKPSYETPKKVPPKSEVEELAQSEIREIMKVSTLKKSAPKAKQPTKKPSDTPSSKTVIEITTTKTTKKDIPKYVPGARTTLKRQPEIHKTTKTKFIGQTEYQDEYSKVSKFKKDVTRRPDTKTTLYNVERIENLVDDNTVHIRSNRVDDTVNKKKTSVVTTKLVNGDVTRTKPKGITKQTTPTKKAPIKPEPIHKTPSTFSTAHSRHTTTVKKTVVHSDTKPKSTRPAEPRKHVVTTTINVSPTKGKPAQPKTSKTSVTKTVTTTKTKKTTSEKPTKIQNGYASTDTDDESTIESVEGSFIDLTDKRSKFTRTSSDRTFETSEKVPARGLSKPEVFSDSKQNREHCITTKTVLISNKDTPQEREFVVDLQRSKSSREPTPDRLCPRPLTSDEEEDAVPRYPDQISEPEDGSLRRKPKRLSDLPIQESEDTEFSRITEVTDVKRKITEIDKVEETDESLLSIDKKINKFLDTADKLTKEPIKPKPAGKVQRQPLDYPEDLESDECLLSVSDKVSKFITTAEQLITPQPAPDRPKTPVCSTDISVQKKRTQFQTTVEEVNKPSKPSPKVERPDLDNVDDSLKEDECLLSVSDKVNKFISTAERLTSTTTGKVVSLSKIDISPKGTKQPRPTTDRKSPIRDTTTDCVQIDTEEQMYTRKSPSLSPERRKSPSPDLKTPNRRPSNQYSSILKTETTETRHSPREDSPKLPESTPKSSRRPSQGEKTVLSATSRLRSTESIKKAKALFENIDKENEITTQKDIMSRPSVFEGRKTDTLITKQEDSLKKTQTKTEERKTVTDKISRSSPERSPQRARSPDKVEVHRFRPSSPEKIPEIVTTSTPRSREPSPLGDIPHYMMPLDRSLRPNSPHRESISQAKPSHPSTVEDVDVRQTKFGVTLKRTDSAKMTKSTESTSVTSERRRSSHIFEKRITEEEVEEIFELEILEELLEKVVGYDLRRKIRAQIRLVKKLISEGTLESYIAKRRTSTSKTEMTIRRGSSPSKTVRIDDTPKSPEYLSTYTRNVSPDRKVIDNKLYKHSEVHDKRERMEEESEYKSSYSYSERRSSSEHYSKIPRKTPSPVRDTSSPIRDRSSPSKDRSSPDRKTTKSIESTPYGKTTTVKTTESVPGGIKTTTTKTTESKSFTNLKKIAPVGKKLLENDQPEWVKNRNLRKTSETTAPTGKKTSTTTVTSRKTSSRSSPVKEVKPIDIITSSYGVGPTDENGTPLFGLKALRAQNKVDTKVQGTMVKSEYYSETGKEPVGQVSVTKYSTDPKDLDKDGVVSVDGGITSITTTQKFGYKDTPSLKSLTDHKKEICETSEKSTSKSTKINRRGSVKALSQKFIDNAVETLKSERQTSYPKAGLILRTSSFKSGEQSRETSPEEQHENVTVTTTKSSKSGETFLTNKSKISGVQDVITRMKTEEYREGETEEDIAARGLLNKFIGSQVILSGMESHISTRAKTSVSTSPSGIVTKSTKVTTTVTEGGKPSTTCRTFQHPLSQQELETVWDEQTLQLLLEQSTDYEERRIVRARLRQVMAEQEACTALVDEATKAEGPTTPSTPPATTGGQIEEQIEETTKEVKREGDVTTTRVTTRVSSQQQQVKKPISPFAKFRQLDKQNSLNRPTPPRTSN